MLAPLSGELQSHKLHVHVEPHIYDRKNLIANIILPARPISEALNHFLQSDKFDISFKEANKMDR